MSFQFQLYDKTENWFAIAEKNGFDSLSLGQLMRGGNIMKNTNQFKYTPPHDMTTLKKGTKLHCKLKKNFTLQKEKKNLNLIYKRKTYCKNVNGGNFVAFFFIIFWRLEGKKHFNILHINIY